MFTARYNSCPQIRGMGMGGGKCGLRVFKATELSSNGNSENSRIWKKKLTPWAQGSRQCQRAFPATGLLPEKNTRCFSITYFKNLFCYLQASQVVRSLLLSRWGLGKQDGWQVTFLSWMFTARQNLEPKPRPERKLKGTNTFLSCLGPGFLLFPLKTVLLLFTTLSLWLEHTFLEEKATRLKSLGFEMGFYRLTPGSEITRGSKSSYSTSRPLNSFPPKPGIKMRIF